MRIVGWVKSSTLDYPGHICTAVFTPGCNFRCHWCHNKSAWDAREEKHSDEVLAFLQRRKGLLDGVAISGGEPTLQPDLSRFIADVKEMGFKVKLDTNGSNLQIVQDMLDGGMLDYVAVDYKAPWPRYDEICGCPVDVQAVRHTMDIVIRSGIDYELRTTVLPELSISNLINMARSMPELNRYALQLYRPLDNSPNSTRSPKWLEEAAEVVKQYQPNTIVRA